MKSHDPMTIFELHWYLHLNPFVKHAISLFHIILMSLTLFLSSTSENGLSPIIWNKPFRLSLTNPT